MVQCTKKQKGGIKKILKEIFRGDGCVCCLDIDDGFTGICKPYLLSICSCMSTACLSIKLLKNNCFDTWMKSSSHFREACSRLFGIQWWMRQTGHSVFLFWTGISLCEANGSGSRDLLSTETVLHTFIFRLTDIKTTWEVFILCTSFYSCPMK